MKKKIYELIMKHPITFIMAAISLVIPYFIAFVFWNWHAIKDIGMLMVLITSIVFSFMPICFWGVVYTISMKSYLKLPMSKNDLEDLKLIYPSWEYGILIVCFINALISFLMLFICYYYSLSFKIFFFSTYLIPICRMVLIPIDYLTAKKYLISKQKNEFNTNT